MKALRSLALIPLLPVILLLAFVGLAEGDDGDQFTSLHKLLNAVLGD